MRKNGTPGVYGGPQRVFGFARGVREAYMRSLISSFAIFLNPYCAASSDQRIS
jgi:hypothetical protein